MHLPSKTLGLGRVPPKRRGPLVPVMVACKSPKGPVFCLTPRRLTPQEKGVMSFTPLGGG